MDFSNSYGTSGNAGVVDVAGKIMLGSIAILFFVVIFLICLHLYARWFRYGNRQNTAATARWWHRRDFAAGRQEATAVSVLGHGLDPRVLKTIPLKVYEPKDFEDGLECTVCLCEVSEGEKIRLLPKCYHGFHVECIDMWLHSHSTCPLCRSPVADEDQSDSAAGSSTETVTLGVNPTEGQCFPANVLVWGNETQVCTSGLCVEEDHQDRGAIADPSSSSSPPSSSSGPAGVLIIDVPSHIDEEEEQKSPMAKGLRSLNRLLSGS